MTAVVDDLFGDLLDLIAGEVMPPPLRHSSDTDLYPVIEVLAAALAEDQALREAEPQRRRLIRARLARHQNVARPARRAVRRNHGPAGPAVVLAETPAPTARRCCRGARCRRVRDVGPSGYCPRCLPLSEQAADAYALIAPDWDDASSGRCGPVRVLVLWECRELIERRAQAAPPQAGDVAA